MLEFDDLLLIGGVVGMLWFYLKNNPNALTGLTSSLTSALAVVPTNVGPTVTIDLTSKILQFCQAIAQAEGFGIAGAAPTVNHNPGDLGPGDTGYPGSPHGGSIVSALPDDATGWAFLQRKITNAFTGRSSVFNTAMTVWQFGKKYAGSDAAATADAPGPWALNVSSYLGISPQTTIDQWLQS